MSNPSEDGLLRDELARAMAEARKRDGILEQQRIRIGQLRIQNGQLGGGRVAAGQGERVHHIVIG